MLRHTIILFAALLLAAPAAAQECLRDGGTLVASLNCTGVPTIDKFFAPATFSWAGRDYLAVNTGNDLSMFNIEAPQTPVIKAQSHFLVPNQGDSNYDLVNYSICDDCRWGVATFKRGQLLFDLGTGTVPKFVAKHLYESGNPAGAFTFTYGAEQYLVANKLPEDCGGDATLYRVTGVEEIERVGCVDVPSALPWQPVNGIRVGDYLYLGFSNSRVYIYEVQPGPVLSYTGSWLVGQMVQGGKGVDVDGGLAVSAAFDEGLKFYDITNPAAPVEIAAMPGYFSVAAIRQPFAWAVKAGWNDSPRAFDIKRPAHPVEMDADFWNPNNPWNSHSPDCEWPNGAVFSPDASTLYLARHAVVQLIDFGACPPPEPPMFADGFESGNTSAWSITIP